MKTYNPNPEVKPSQLRMILIGIIVVLLILTSFQSFSQAGTEEPVKNAMVNHLKLTHQYIPNN